MNDKEFIEYIIAHDGSCTSEIIKCSNTCPIFRYYGGHCIDVTRAFIAAIKFSTYTKLKLLKDL
ncbi:MAG: hypothetical protein ABSG25_11695 [Bryobacteraceae bacterium]